MTTYEKNWEAEYKKYSRHQDFLATMIRFEEAPIDWDCFWSWYYHSNCTPKEALKRSKNP